MGSCAAPSAKGDDKFITTDYLQQCQVFSLLMTAMTLSMPIGLLVAGPVVEVIGVNTWFFWSGVALIVNAVLCRILTRRYDKVTMKPQVD